MIRRYWKCVVFFFWFTHIVNPVHSDNQTEINRVEWGNLILENIPPIPEKVQTSLHPYLNTRSASLAGWHPSGNKLYIKTRFAETPQIHSVSMPGGARTQHTFSMEPVSAVAVCPGATQNTLLFTKDEDGQENYQIYQLDTATNDVRQITDGTARNLGVVWSTKGDRFVYSSTKRNQKDYDIYIANTDNPGEAELLLQNSGLWIPLDWSPDGNQLLLIHYVSINESYLYTLNLQSKEMKQINPSDEKIAYAGQAEWTRHGNQLYFISDQDSEFLELRSLDMESKELTSFTTEIPWNITSFDLSDDGRYLAFVSNENGVSKLHLLYMKNKQKMGTLPVPVGVISDISFSLDGEKLALTIDTPASPEDVYVINIPKYDDFERWTFSETGGLDPDYFVSPELIHYKTFDEVDGASRTIPAFYYKPVLESHAPHPVLIYIHGGPESQYRPRFNGSFQYFLNELNMAVVAPNVRGSNGYGKSYLKLDNGTRREDSVKDIGALLDWIKEQPELDETRVVVMGGSYGGYMVLASMIHYSERLLAGIEIVGISNFVTFLENTKEYRRELRREEYGDESNPDMREFLHQISPTTNAAAINKPMLIAQGLNDPRVPAGESEQIVQSIRDNGQTVWYLLAKDEGHGFKKQSNREIYYQTVGLFLRTVLPSTP